MSLPADDHVHTQFSWDAAPFGSMEGCCARAVELGLPSIAFTEHAEFTVSRTDPRVRERLAPHVALALAGSAADFEVLAHVDHPVRYAPGPTGWPGGFEEEIRAVLAALAASGRVLELNSVLPLDGAVLGWWRQAGGTAISFASDAHEPAELGRHWAEAAAAAEAHGFGPGEDPAAFWSVR